MVNDLVLFGWMDGWILVFNNVTMLIIVHN